MAKFDLHKTQGINHVLNAVQQVQSVNNILPLTEAKELLIDNLRPSGENFYAVTDLDELSESIRAWGVLQPLLVSEQVNGVYEIIAGNRRYEAARMAGLQRLPCIVKQNVEPNLFKILLIHANMFRVKSDIERATEVAELKKAILALKAADKSLKGRTGEIAGQLLNLSARQVNRLDNLNKLIPEIKELVQADRLTASCAEQFAGLDESAQREIYGAILRDGTEISRGEAARLKEAYQSDRELQKVKEALVSALQDRQEIEERYRQLSQGLTGSSPEDAERLVNDVRRSAQLQECIGQLRLATRAYTEYKNLCQAVSSSRSARETQFLNELIQQVKSLSGLVTAE